MLTFEEFSKYPHDEIFATGVVKNSPDELYMVSSNIGRELLWAAKKGEINDFAIYCHWNDSHDAEWVRDYGDKIYNLKYVQMLLDCDDDVLKCYRM